MSWRQFTGKVWLMLGAVLLLVFIGALVLFSSAPSPVPSARLPDGTTLEFLKATFGKQHELDLRPWKDRFSSFLSGRFPKIFGRVAAASYPAGISSTNESLTVWFRRTRPGGSSNISFDVYLLDGAETACRESDDFAEYSLNPTQEVVGYLFTTYPRDARNLLVQFNYEFSHKPAVARFSFANEHPKVSATWAAEPLPTVRRKAGMEFILTRLQSGVDFNSQANRRATNLEQAATLAGFRVLHDTKVLTNWSPVKIRLTDATGNVSENLAWSDFSQSDEKILLFQWGLWPTGPAWKLNVEFARTSGFGTNEVWNVIVPVTKLVPSTNYFDWKRSSPLASSTIDGTQIRIVALRDRSDRYPLNDRLSARPFSVEVQIEPDRGDHHLTLLHVYDQHGQEMEGSGSSSSGGNYHFEFRDLNSATALNISLAYHQSRFVEYIAKPEPFVEDKPDANAR